MKFHYDKESDSLYINFIDGAGIDTVVVTDDIVADIDAKGRLVGLDIQCASQQSDLGNFIVEGMNPVLRPAG